MNEKTWSPFREFRSTLIINSLFLSTSEIMIIVSTIVYV